VLKLSWKQINDSAFCQAVIRLSSQTNLDNITAYRIGRIREAAIKAMKIAADAEQRMKLKHGIVEEGQKLSDEAVKELDAMFESTQVEIKVNTLDFNQLKGLTPPEILAISEICHNLPAEE
jgi:hypothetical protein